MNSIVLLGRLTRDPELKKANDGNSICIFTLAVDNGKDETLFINCSSFAEKADLMVKTLRKGSLIAVEGKLAQKTYEKQNGEKAISFVVKINNFDYCEKKKEETTESKKPNTPEDIFNSIDLQDDLPF